MKNFAAVALRYLTTFITALACAASMFLVIAILDNGSNLVGDLVYASILASVPLAIVAASCISFFLMNRLLTSRIKGYAMLFVSSVVALAGPTLLVRFLGGPATELFASLPSSYAPTARWVIAVAESPWVDYAAGIGAFSLFSGSFWACTRLSRTRPLLGAFLAPSSAIAALYLFSIYLSGPADALFSLAGLRLGDVLRTAALTGASAAALWLLDALVARKPSGRRRDA